MYSERGLKKTSGMDFNHFPSDRNPKIPPAAIKNFLIHALLPMGSKCSAKSGSSRILPPPGKQLQLVPFPSGERNWERKNDRGQTPGSFKESLKIYPPSIS